MIFRIFIVPTQQAHETIRIRQTFSKWSCLYWKFKELRIKSGIACPHCGNKEHIWLPTSMHFECKSCHSRRSLRSGTIMHGSKLPFLYWFKAIHLLTSTKKTFSASELQRQLGHKRYQPIWEMLHKIRSVMGQRDAQYTLSGIIRTWWRFFSTERDEAENQRFETWTWKSKENQSSGNGWKWAGWKP